MNSLLDMVWIETRKVIRSRLPLFSMLGLLILPFIAGFFMVVLKDPEFARKTGLISTKAHLAGNTADWPTYFLILSQGIGVGGFIVFSVIVAWVFGREFADRTVKDLLAVPVSRFSILLAKFIVSAIWFLLLILIVYCLSMIIGTVLELPLGSRDVILQGSITMIVTGCMAIAVVAPVGFFASIGRGYLPAIGATFLLVALANVIAVAGWGMYFPWSVPGLYAGAAGNDVGLGPFSFILVALTGLAGVIGTYAWWKTADQAR